MSERRRVVGSALRLLNYRLECEETRQWLRSKAQTVEATAELGRDLAGVLATQRKLYGIERELAVAKDRLATLRSQADRLAEERPEVAGEVAERLSAAAAAWEELQEALGERAASLGEAGQLQCFLQDLDDFQAWLFGAQKAVAATDEVPASLAEAEELLRCHEATRRDVEEHAAAFAALVEAGERVVGEQADPEYEGLRQRLRGVEAGWAALGRMAEARHRFLTQCHGFQEFLHDTKQAEILLTNQVGAQGGSRVGVLGSWAPRKGADPLLCAPPGVHAGSPGAAHHAGGLGRRPAPLPGLPRRRGEHRREGPQGGGRRHQASGGGEHLCREDRREVPGPPGAVSPARGRQAGRRVGSVWAAGLMLPVSGHPARHGAVTAKVEEAAGLLQDNHELQTFLQRCQEVGTWHSR